MKTKYLESQLYKCSHIFQSSKSQQFPSSRLTTTTPGTIRELSHGLDTKTHVVLGQVWMDFAEMLKLSALSNCQGVHNQQMCPDLGFILYVSATLVW